MPSIHPLNELYKNLRAKRLTAHGSIKQIDSFIYEIGLGTTVHVCGLNWTLRRNISINEDAALTHRELKVVK